MTFCIPAAPQGIIIRGTRAHIIPGMPFLWVYEHDKKLASKFNQYDHNLFSKK